MSPERDRELSPALPSPTTSTTRVLSAGDADTVSTRSLVAGTTDPSAPTSPSGSTSTPTTITRSDTNTDPTPTGHAPVSALNARRSQGLSQMQTSNGAGPAQKCDWKEWRPWELGVRWLSFQLALALGGAIAVAGLAVYSRAHSGFVRLGPPPSILRRNAELMDAIWMQGWLYTAIPVSLMTLYRTMWGGVIASLAARQPYVELRKPNGGPPEKTILLDYRAEWPLAACRTAFCTGHWFLGACMAMSFLLSFVAAPSAAFLFAATTATSQFPVPLRYTSQLNYTAIRGPLGTPSAQTALEWGAATVSLKAPPLPWTNGTHAYSPFELSRDLQWPDEDTSPTGNPGPISIAVDSTAHFFQPHCLALREGVDYQAELLPVDIPGLDSVMLSITGSDRGCTFSDVLIFNLREPLFTAFRPVAAKTFQRLGCEMMNNNNASLVGIVAGRYTGDRIADHRVSDISVVSCMPRYWSVPGVLNATLARPPSQMPLAAITAFYGNWSRAVEYTQGEHMYVESAFVEPLAFDPSLPMQVPTNNFVRYVFELAALSSSRNSTNGRLDVAVLALSMADLLERAYAAVAAAILTTPLDVPGHHIGYATASEVRITVRERVAWVMVPLFLCAAVLLSYILGVERHRPAALFEEPVGLLGIAGIAQRSAHLTGEIAAIGRDSRFRGKFREDAMASEAFMATNWRFDEQAGHIVNTTGTGLQTAHGSR